MEMKLFLDRHFTPFGGLPPFEAYSFLFACPLPSARALSGCKRNLEDLRRTPQVAMTCNHSASRLHVRSSAARTSTGLSSVPLPILRKGMRPIA
jgi:hypothetical protein